MAGSMGLRGLALAAMLACTTQIANAQGAADFYKGKTIQIIVSTGPGTGHDNGVRLVARHMQKHMPGLGGIITKNMPGGGHVLAANYIHNTAPKDGLTLAAILPAFILHQLIDGRGVRYDVRNFVWIGSSLSDNMNLYVWHTAGIKSLDDVYKKEVIMGATGVGSYTATFPTVMNNLLGTKFKIVPGYRTTGQIHLAMEKGEVQGRAGNFFSSLKSDNADWLRDKKIDLILQIGVKRDPEFANVPLMSELGKTPEQNRVLQLFSSEIAMGRAFSTTPKTPPDRVAYLRRAFEATMKDKEYIAEATKLRLPVRPLTHAQLEEILAGIMSTPPELIAQARKAKFGDTGPGGKGGGGKK
ncbi:MAG: Bug family tripartite tricarboxylate transporter substrate binding protein [Beijerinckiaceae bacterium]